MNLKLAETDNLQISLDLEAALRPNNFDAAFVCLKVHDNQAAAPLAALSKDTVIISLQNGVENQRILSELLPSHVVVAGMVPYGVVEVSPGHFRRGTYGSLAFRDTLPQILAEKLRSSGLGVELYNEEDMLATQWGKLVINLGNALNAIVGQPLAACMQLHPYRRLLALLWEEGITVLNAKGIAIHADINGQPLEKVVKLLTLPGMILKTAQRIKGVKTVDASYHSSMFYDLEQLRTTEVNELNKKIVQMASEEQLQAPVNALITRLVEEAEASRRGSPHISVESLLEQASDVAPEKFSKKCCMM